MLFGKGPPVVDLHVRIRIKETSRRFLVNTNVYTCTHACLGMKKAMEVKLFETLLTTKPVAGVKYKSRCKCKCKCRRKEDHPF
jgi:hypothetical protein